MGLAAVANWLFNFALGLFLPPAFVNITYKIFIIFGVPCCGAAVQAYLPTPETCGKNIEEIELLFSKGGPKPWNTKPGGSRLDAEIQAVLERRCSSFKFSRSCSIEATISFLSAISLFRA
jgi:hypothetical protein